MNVIVTGASSGVGYELVKKLLDKSEVSKVVGIARREEKLQELTDYASSIGRTNKFIRAIGDVCTMDFSSILKSLNRVDAIVNNAGLLISKPFRELSKEEFMRIYDVNVFAPVRIIQSFLPALGGEKPSHIVNIGSMGGFQGASKFPGLSAYSSSKSALAGLSECLAEEFKDSNIKVNCLAFGAVQTEMLEKAFPGFQAPLNSSEMADFVLDFTLNGHHYFNGKILPVSSSTP